MEAKVTLFIIPPSNSQGSVQRDKLLLGDLVGELWIALVDKEQRARRTATMAGNGILIRRKDDCSHSGGSRNIYL